MKIFILLTFLLNLSFALDFTNAFDLEVQNAYEKYQVYDEYESPYYSLKVIYGLVNDEIRYGICFFSMQAKEYSMVIVYQGQQYTLPSNKRGDVSVVALALKASETFSLEVYDQAKQYQSSSVFQNISVITKEDFLNLSNLETGFNQGTKTTKLSFIQSWSSLSVFYYGLLGVFGICALVLIIFYWRKKGFFDDAIRQDVSEPQILPLMNTQEQPTSDEFEEFVQPTNNEFEGFEQPQNHKALYHHEWQEEEPSNFDIKAHLEALGFLVNYHMLLEHEKFMIMKELIHLRDQKQITQDEYLEEVSHLWKN